MPERTGQLLFLLLLAFVIWVPMPFGSASDASQLPLIVTPLILCAAATFFRASGKHLWKLTRPGLIWTAGGIAFALTIAFQLVPMPRRLLSLFSPESAAIWGRAERLATLAGVQTSSMHPITIDPSTTELHLFRVVAFLSTFLAAMILVDNRFRRTVLASVLGAVGVFEAAYAVNESTKGTYAVWGWKNTLIFGRATGTFVNPNHFANYAGILLPMTIYLAAYVWHTAAPSGATFNRRLIKLVERRIVPFSLSLFATLACLAAVLVSESRGAMLSIVGAFAVVGGIARPRGTALFRGALIAIGALAAIASVVLVLDRTEAVNRIEQSRPSDFYSRLASVTGAIRIWELFPLFGSGAGTYQNVVLMTRATPSDVLANHAHNDYAEVLATTGVIGFAISVLSLFGGFTALAVSLFGAGREPMSWRRKAFMTAALASLAVAIIHALVDFNFFIPANPATLAAIAGAAAAKEP